MEVRLFVLGLESNPCLPTGPEPNMTWYRAGRFEPWNPIVVRFVAMRDSGYGYELLKRIVTLQFRKPDPKFDPKLFEQVKVACCGSLFMV
jgi:hypothetical protein